MKSSLAIAALAALVTASGCRDNRGSVEVYGLCGPPEAADTCTQTAECETFLAGRPWMSTLIGGVPNPLYVWIRFDNQLPDNSNAGTGRTNTNDFYGEEMDLVFSGAGTATPVTVPVAFTVPASGSVSPLLNIVPQLQASQLFATLPAGVISTVLVEATFRGHFVSGSAHEIGPYQIVVDVDNFDCGGFTCPAAGDVVLSVCPKECQTATVECGTP